MRNKDSNERETERELNLEEVLSHATEVKPDLWSDDGGGGDVES